ncbi:MAG TPA: hypothetical protein VNK04_07530 [Gemmataceae bacterium]|nr:hypothetical protein [Gemmataceae bacterium]
MYRAQHPTASEPRRGLVLLVVLFMLTLFAIAGLSLVLYADAEATAARLHGSAAHFLQPDMEPEEAFAFFLNQLIYDCPDDERGVYSALRGHSLARNMYGLNYNLTAGPIGTITMLDNVTPFNGTGRLRTGLIPGLNHDDYELINYTFFPVDQFLRDPERLNWNFDPQTSAITSPKRADFNGNRGEFTGGFNVPYTYPDLNNLFLAAVKADGTLLTPSFHRPWLFNPTQGLNDPTNPNWTNKAGKYLILRPRPVDQLTQAQVTSVGLPWPLPDPSTLPPAAQAALSNLINTQQASGKLFPYPEDATGDVKNLIGAPGGNDSIWIDIGAPVLTAPDGRKYKMLVAPLILDLDSRININVHGNNRGNNNTHVSNQGWGRWEINPRRIGAANQGEWANLFIGNNGWLGRYKADLRPGNANDPNNKAQPGTLPHSYGQVDFDGTVTGPIQLPAAGTTVPFPTFPAGYDNGNDVERTDHPLLYNVFKRSFDPTNYDKRFAASNLEWLYRYGDTNTHALATELYRLLPLNLQDPRIRRMLTTHSFDIDQPGVSPWLMDRDTSGYGYTTATTLEQLEQAPRGPSQNFPSLTMRSTAPAANANTDFNSVDWRPVANLLGRINLSRFLPPYPHQGSGKTQAEYSAAPLVTFGNNTRFDDGGAIQEQFLAAQTARQELANDIYRRLLAVTGVKTPTNKAAPTDEELMPRRWLAQLAVNIVDYIDEDEISTPFNFYNTADGLPAAEIGARGKWVNESNELVDHPELPKYWVFGTELPRIILNEVMAEQKLPTVAKGKHPVRVWVELFNPLPENTYAGAPPTEIDTKEVPLHITKGTGPTAAPYSPYKIVIANTATPPGGSPPNDPLLPRLKPPQLPAPGNNDNVTGAPEFVRTEATFLQDKVGTVVDPAPKLPMSVGPQKYFLVGPPSGKDERDSIKPPRVDGGTKLERSPGMEYVVDVDDTGNFNDKAHGITVLLRRLANPYMPPNPDPTNPLYNPYITVDYIERVRVQNVTDAEHASVGKLQPYGGYWDQAADKSQIRDQVEPLTVNMDSDKTKHTFGKQNNPGPPNHTYDWLVHLDRHLISPMELLHVSGYKPHLLTHRFIMPANTPGQWVKHNHRVPWFDEDITITGQSHRLYRLFEFLATRDYYTNVLTGGRVPGKININTVWDPEILAALIDPQPSNYFNTIDVNNLFNQLLASRTPSGGIPTGNDRPFRGMAVGHSPGGASDPLYPNGAGIDDTLLRPATVGGGGNAPRLFEFTPPNPPPDPPHPYQRFELLTKIWNHLTVRSNVFAVWVTVGFFEVIDDTTRPVKLGAEIGRAENRHIRHRMFAIIDRSNLSLTDQPTFFVTGKEAVTVPPGNSSVNATVTIVRPDQTEATSGYSEDYLWQIKPNDRLLVDPGPNQEIITVTNVTNTQITATFQKSHPAGFLITNMGNPGPKPAGFDPRLNRAVVRYFSIID